MNIPSQPIARPIVTLMTDFGLRDGFVGVMKGVILSRASEVEIVDISHGLPPYDIQAAAFLLDWAFSCFPQGTVHTVVVDPGVGTARDVLVLEALDQKFICPDNGVLSYIWPRCGDTHRLVCAENPSLWLTEISSTFHGRDIFAPLAAFLASGGDMDRIGPKRAQPKVLLPPLQIEFGTTEVDAEVCYIDRFGNLVTTITRSALLQWTEERGVSFNDVVIKIGTSRLTGVSPSYNAVEKDFPVAVFDGYGRLEIAINQDRADQVLNAAVGERVTVCIP
ncbi:MAG: SAM-dependent chlorinase/fluorinase [bacterium]